MEASVSPSCTRYRGRSSPFARGTRAQSVGEEAPDRMASSRGETRLRGCTESIPVKATTMSPRRSPSLASVGIPVTPTQIANGSKRDRREKRNATRPDRQGLENDLAPLYERKGEKSMNAVAATSM